MKNIIIVLTVVLSSISCNKESDKEPKVNICPLLNMENINETIPIINHFLTELPNDTNKEQTFKSLKTWLNSFACNINAQILYSTDVIWGKKEMYGISISVQDGEIIRELELDFAIINRAITYSQITGYRYLKQNTVSIKTKYTKIDKVFEFVNSLDFEVKEIQGGVYLSSMPADKDTLKYIVDNLKAKPYTNNAWVTGHLNWYNANIVIFVNLYNMKNVKYQVDWKETMNEYKLRNYDNGSKHVIKFYIPEGTGKQWEEKFVKYDFVDWAELGYTEYTIPSKVDS